MEHQNNAKWLSKIGAEMTMWVFSVFLKDSLMIWAGKMV